MDVGNAYLADEGSRLDKRMSIVETKVGSIATKEWLDERFKGIDRRLENLESRVAR
jgi:hypothetical protein